VLGLPVCVDIFGFRRDASAAGLLPTTCPSTKLERPSHSLSALASFSGTWAWLVVLLAVAIVLVSFGGAPDLMELGRVAYVWFLLVSYENCVVLVFLVWFFYKLDTWYGYCVYINFRPIFLINWSLSLFFLIKKQRSYRLLKKSHKKYSGSVEPSSRPTMLSTTPPGNCPTVSQK
jgi:hypothetical protein